MSQSEVLATSGSGHSNNKASGGSGHEEESGSVMSASSSSLISQSGATQTRFSFYKAEDFSENSDQHLQQGQQQQPTPKAGPRHNAGNPDQDYISPPDAVGLTAASPGHMNTATPASPLHRDSNVAMVASVLDADSGEGHHHQKPLSEVTPVSQQQQPEQSLSEQQRFMFYKNTQQAQTPNSSNLKHPPDPGNSSGISSHPPQVPQQQQQQQQQQHRRDSAEILRSLQEHEQQRLEILSGPSATAVNTLPGGPSSSRHAGAGRSDTQQHTSTNSNSNPYEDAIKEALDLLRKHRNTASSSGLAGAIGGLGIVDQQPRVPSSHPGSPAVQHPPTTSGASLPPISPRSPPPILSSINASNAPIGNSILQQHAAGSVTSPLSLLQQQQQQYQSVQSQPAGDETGSALEAMDGSVNAFYFDESGNPLLDPHAAVINSASAASLHATVGLNSATTGTAVSPNQLGETYQAEIEARRKQRQERMARYASRLAELKQESDQKAATSSSSDTGVPSSNNTDAAQIAASAIAEAIHSNSGNVPPEAPPRVDTSMAEAWGHADAAQSAKSAPSIMDASSNAASDSVEMPPPVSRALLHPTGHATSVLPVPANIAESLVGSTASSKNTEEEVQRGVERVLLAILERAHSQGRARGASEGKSNDNDRPTSQRDHQQQPSQRRVDAAEEKKSYDDTQQQQKQHATMTTSSSLSEQKEEENSLVRAMSDLLGVPSSTSTLGSWSPTRQALQHLEQQQQAPHHDEGDQRVKEVELRRPEPLVVRSPGGASAGDTLVELSSSEGQLARGQTAAASCHEPVINHATAEIGAAVAADVDADEWTDKSSSTQDETPYEPGATGDKMNESDALDEMVRQVLIRKEAGSEDDDASQSDSNEPDDSLDRRVRVVVSNERQGGNVEETEDGTSDSASTIDDDLATRSRSRSEDETIESSNDEGGIDDSCEPIDDLSYEDEPSDSDQPLERDGVLGPLSEKAGGTTGVVLEPDPPVERAVASPSILDSLSAAMSLVTGNNAQADGKNDKYAAAGSREEDEEASELMRTLCAHLLPVGVSNQSSKLLDKLPEWDESNPDEAGYRIIRLTTRQLASVEHAFDRMVSSLKHNSQRDLVGASGSDEAFERDLQAAEELLYREEMRKQEADKTLEQASDGPSYSALPKPSAEEVFDGSGSGIVFAREMEESDLLPEFPGVKPTGRGEMGDLEFFSLPIIFKSHVTGFEPTKDLYLEAGNVVAGQYLVAGELGSAAFSTAYRCVDLNSEGDGPDGHDEVCLKVIKNTKDFFDQSLDEIKILELLRQTGRCRVKNIVEMKTFFYHREHLVIVTELLRQNLFEFGKFILDNDEEPYFTMHRLSFITRQVLIALEFVHKLGLVHCDVKPENILLSSYSRAQVKLIDFGSSCFLTDRQSSYIQSRSYRAPEVVLGLPYDGRIDIWSLGCVVAEMFTGEVTFQNDSIVSMLSRIEAICGPFPRHMIAQGRQSGRFFAKCGLLYEKVPDEEKGNNSDHGESQTSDEDEDNSERGPRYVDVFQPKVTSLSSRLGFSPDLMERFDSGKKLTKDEKRHAIFVDFVRKLLTIDPDARPTATEALDHPWTRLAASLTEEDIKYPPS